MIDFIKAGINASEIAKAARQETQLSYFTLSDIQATDVNEKYIEQWAERNFQSDNHFLNYLKSVFKEDIFQLLYKYLRFPAPSASLIQNRIIPDLKRVFHAEDRLFSYNVSGVDQSDYETELNDKDFIDELFYRILFKHNSILVTHIDADIPNKPVHHFIDISKVRSIEMKLNTISRIAYRASIQMNGEYVDGTIYIDSLSYIFYPDDNEENPIIKSHDLTFCPAAFIVNDSMNSEKIVKKSLFSYIRGDLEEYTLNRTIQRMVEPNGTIPVGVKLDFKEKSQTHDFETKDSEPGTANSMSSQRAKIKSETGNKKNGFLQAGTMHTVPSRIIEGGKIDVDIVKNLIHWIYIPTEALRYWDERLQSLKNSILSLVNGDIVTANESAKNELQITKSISVLENTLRDLSSTLSRTKRIADRNYLAVKYGINRVIEVNVNFGTDFYLDDEDVLLSNFVKSPNPIERKNILIRLSQNRYRNNSEKVQRQTLLYNLIPFVSDADLQMSGKPAGDIDVILYTQFDYWINRFEATFGNLLEFFDTMEAEVSQKYILIRRLIYELIQEENGKTDNITT